MKVGFKKMRMVGKAREHRALKACHTQVEWRKTGKEGNPGESSN